VTYVSGVSGATAVNDVIDRWWNITSSVNPLPAPGANVTFSYRGVENTLAPSQTDAIAAQHWNGTDWDPIYLPGVPAVTTGVGSVTATNLVDFSPFVLVRAVKPLPVRLVSFQAKAETGFVVLNWQIAQRVNNEIYTIQRSADGRIFEDIGVVRSEGRDRYEWIDKNPLEGVSYYRLKRQDDKGGIEFSQIEAVNLLALVKEGMTVIPNPSNGEAVLIILQSLPQEKSTLTIVDALGKIVYEAELDTDTSGRADKQVRAILAKGVYIAQIRTQSKIYQEKIIVR
ncbi:MAG: T9SS type A sorting domain-containing protein, partial [Raineya sp.]